MNESDETAYCIVIDKHGAKASVYIKPDDMHKIVFTDNNDQKFFTEEFAKCPIELVEQYALDWANGKRKLEGSL